MLAERPPADRAFFDLFEAVNALEQVALTWCPTLAGAPPEHFLAHRHFKSYHTCGWKAARAIQAYLLLLELSTEMRQANMGSLWTARASQCFWRPLEAYFTGVRVKLLQWSDRLLGEVRAALPTWPATSLCAPGPLSCSSRDLSCTACRPLRGVK